MTKQGEEYYESSVKRVIVETMKDELRSVMVEEIKPIVVAEVRDAIAAEVPPAIGFHVNGKIDKLQRTQEEDRKKLDDYIVTDNEFKEQITASINQILNWQKGVEPVVKLKDNLTGFSIIAKYVVLTIIGAGAVVGAVFTILKVFIK